MIKKTVAVLFFLLANLGCSDVGQTPAGLSSFENTVNPEVDDNVLPNIGRTSKSLRSPTLSGKLGILARYLDEIAIKQSPAVNEYLAASATLRARKYDFYPTLRPTASIPLDQSNQETFGIALEQSIWEGGRVQTRLQDTILKVEEARLSAWKERNDTVYTGLKAYIDLTRYNLRIANFEAFKSDLGEIADLMESRLAGGVSDRGELLQVKSATQELQRRIVRDSATQQLARSELLRRLPDTTLVPDYIDLRSAAQLCDRKWPTLVPPQVELKKNDWDRARVALDSVQAQRFPRVLLSGSVSYSPNGWSEPAIGIRLDASDMLGFGRKGNIDSADATMRAAEAAYHLSNEDMEAELAKGESDFLSLMTEVNALKKLTEQNLATLQLYSEQLEAGSIPITQGIVYHRELAETRNALVDAKSNIILNCLESAKNRGLLASYGVDYD